MLAPPPVVKFDGVGASRNSAMPSHDLSSPTRLRPATSKSSTSRSIVEAPLQVALPDHLAVLLKPHEVREIGEFVGANRLWLYFSRRHVRESPAEIVGPDARGGVSLCRNCHLALGSWLPRIGELLPGLGISQLAA